MFQRRVIEEHDEEESIFISMTDLSVSMLLLLVILLGFFASQYRQATVIEQEAVTAAQIASLQMDIAALERRLADADPGGMIRATLRQRIAQEIAAAERLSAGLAQSQSEIEALQLEAEQNSTRAAEGNARLTRERDDARAAAARSRRQAVEALSAREAAAQALQREVALRDAEIASLRLEVTDLAARLADADPGGVIRDGLLQDIAQQSAAAEQLSARLAQSRSEIEALQLEAQENSTRAGEEIARLARERDDARAEASLLQRQVVDIAAERDAAVQDFLREAALSAAQARQFEARRMELEASLAREREQVAAEFAALRDRIAILEGLGAAASRRLASDLSAAREVIAARDAELGAAAGEARALRQLLEDQEGAAATAQADLKSQNAALFGAVERLTLEHGQAAVLFEQRIASLEENLIAANAKIAEAARVAANIEALASAQAQGLERPSMEQDATELRRRIVAQDLEITALRSQIAAMDGLLDALMTATTSLLEKSTPRVGEERGRN